MALPQHGSAPFTQPADVELARRLLVFCTYARWLVAELDALIVRATSPAVGGGPVDFYEQVEQYEVELITWALQRTAGHQRKAARLLKIKETTLHSKIKRYRIDVGALVPSGLTDLR